MSCKICNTEFSSKCNLKRHVKTFHPKLFKKMFQPKPVVAVCNECHKNFSRQQSLTIHVKTFHSSGHEFKPRLARCPVCHADIIYKNINNHFEQVHSIKVESNSLTLGSVKEFETWKLSIEKETKSWFIKHQTSYKTTQGVVVQYYSCNRSGYYKSTSHKRRENKRGSTKINGFCPARLKVTEKNGVCHVLHTHTHVGHQKSLEHLVLSQSDKEYLAQKVDAEIPFNTILKEVRESAMCTELNRLHLLTRKDLFNIKNRKRKNDEVIDTDGLIKDPTQLCIAKEDETNGILKKPAPSKRTKKDEVMVRVIDMDGLLEDPIQQCVAEEDETNIILEKPTTSRKRKNDEMSPRVIDLDGLIEDPTQLCIAEEDETNFILEKLTPSRRRKIDEVSPRVIDMDGLIEDPTQLDSSEEDETNFINETVSILQDDAWRSASEIFKNEIIQEIDNLKTLEELNVLKQIWATAKTSLIRMRNQNSSEVSLKDQTYTE